MESLLAKVTSSMISTTRAQSAMLATMASYERRWEDWTLQRELAEQELIQHDRNVDAAVQRVETAKKDLEVHTRQTEHAQRIHNFLLSKTTSTALYDWMIGQTSATYF